MDFAVPLGKFLLPSTSTVVSKLMVAPLERVRLIMQVKTEISSGASGSINGCITYIIMEQSVWALWRSAIASITRHFANSFHTDYYHPLSS